MKTTRKRPLSGKIREQKFIDSFDADVMDEYEDIAETNGTSFYEMHRRMERDRSLGHSDLGD